MSESSSRFGVQLRRFRERAGLSQASLAERTQLTPAAIAALERGRRRRPYLDTVRRLADALGLTAEEQAAFVAAAHPAHVPTAAAPRTPLSNLPPARNGLIGREEAVAALLPLIRDHAGRSVTLTGIGGAGKTSLALAVAGALLEGFADGVWLAELAPLADPALVPEAVARVLGVPEVAGVSLFDALVAYLRPRTLLLVLDNCEHLIDACAVFAERLLNTCPDVRILATSREPLQIAGERQWRVPPLALPVADASAAPVAVAASAAVQLFVERAQAVDARFALTEQNAATVAEVCVALAGIPLAIELAAARAHVLSVEQIRERLADSLHLLVGSSRAAPTRQQTLRATLDWSYRLLAPDEQALLRRLAVFVDGCEIEAAEAIAADDDLPGAAVLDALGGLANKSLLQVEQSAGASRYRVLEPVRQFAATLTPTAELEGTRQRHAAWYTALVERAMAQRHGPDQIAIIERLQRELGNLRAALSWASARAAAAEIEARLVLALAPFFEGQTHLSEGRRAVAAVLARAPATLDPTLHRRVLLAAGRMAQWQGDLEESGALLRICLADARAAEDHAICAEALNFLGLVQSRRGARAEGFALLQQSLALAREIEDGPAIAGALLSLGFATIATGDYVSAGSMLQECLLHYEQAGNIRYCAVVRTELGAVARLQGNRCEAALLLRQGIDGHLAVGDRTFIGIGLRQAASLLADSAPRQTVLLLGAAESLHELLGTVLSAADRLPDERALAKVRARLSSEEIAAAWAEGRALRIEQAVAAMVADLEALACAPMPPPLPATGPESLTQREQEVAGLLAEGYSDREIAEALSISVRTVGSHVQHALAKLGLHSRWQIADWATSAGVVGPPR